MEIKVLNTDDLVVASEALNIKVGDNTLKIDLVGLMNLPVGSEDCWVDISQVVKLKGKNLTPKAFLRQLEVKEYIAEFYDVKVVDSKGAFKAHLIEAQDSDVSSKIGNQPTLEYTKEMITSPYVVLPFYPTVNGRPVVDVKKGRYGGTWIHRDLFTKFASWMSVEFDVAMHKTFMNVLRNIDSIKVERRETKAMYHELVKVIDNKYAPAQSSYPEQSRHKLMDLVNIVVLGMTSRKFRRIHKLDHSKDIRDYMNDKTLKYIKEVEKAMTNFIDYGDIVEYNELKSKLIERFDVVKSPFKE